MESFEKTRADYIHALLCRSCGKYEVTCIETTNILALLLLLSYGAVVEITRPQTGMRRLLES